MPGSRPELVGSIVHSLVETFVRALDGAATRFGRTVRTVHVVGGVAKNALLCRACGDLEAMPTLVAATHELVTYRPGRRR